MLFPLPPWLEAVSALKTPLALTLSFLLGIAWARHRAKKASPAPGPKPTPPPRLPDEKAGLKALVQSLPLVRTKPRLLPPPYFLRCPHCCFLALEQIEPQKCRLCQRLYFKRQATVPYTFYSALDWRHYWGAALLSLLQGEKGMAAKYKAVKNVAKAAEHQKYVEDLTQLMQAVMGQSPAPKGSTLVLSGDQPLFTPLPKIARRWALFHEKRPAETVLNLQAAGYPEPATREYSLRMFESTSEYAFGDKKEKAAAGLKIKARLNNVEFMETQIRRFSDPRFLNLATLIAFSDFGQAKIALFELYPTTADLAPGSTSYTQLRVLASLVAELDGFSGLSGNTIAKQLNEWVHDWPRLQMAALATPATKEGKDFRSRWFGRIVRIANEEGVSRKEKYGDPKNVTGAARINALVGEAWSATPPKLLKLKKAILEAPEPFWLSLPAKIESGLSDKVNDQWRQELRRLAMVAAIDVVNAE